MKKPTLILGASLNEIRYSNRAIKKLVDFNIEVIAVGKNKGETHGIKIQNEFPLDIEINTLSIYINVFLQNQYVDSIIELLPNRVIFNPGTENPELFNLLSSKGIECENSCTLVLLSTNQY
ncbi:MAG: CoA-binding protein [Flavobacteriaceae bacterium]|nr:CoA-binding protein [Flavobacteriaceae bacterium]